MSRDRLALPHFSRAQTIKQNGCGFSFVHASDIHIANGSSPRLRPEDAPGRDGIVSDFSYLVRQWVGSNLIDFVLVTGDLGETGVRSDQDKARWLLYGHKDRLTNSYRGLTPIPLAENDIYFMPGNHDRFSGSVNWRSPTMPRIPTNNIFHDIFSDRWPLGTTTTTSELFESTDGRKAFLVMADFNLDIIRDGFSEQTGKWRKYRKERIPEKFRTNDFAENFAYLGQGEAYEAVVSELVAKTQSLQDDYDNCVVLWAIHYPPFFDGIDGHSCLLGEKLVLDAAGEMEIPAVFCGHTHEARDYFLENQAKSRIICAPTLAKYAPTLAKRKSPGFYFVSIEMKKDDGVGVYATKYNYSDQERFYY